MMQSANQQNPAWRHGTNISLRILVIHNIKRQLLGGGEDNSLKQTINLYKLNINTHHTLPKFDRRLLQEKWLGELLVNGFR